MKCSELQGKVKDIDLQIQHMQKERESLCKRSIILRKLCFVLESAIKHYFLLLNLHHVVMVKEAKDHGNRGIILFSSILQNIH